MSSDDGRLAQHSTMLGPVQRAYPPPNGYSLHVQHETDSTSCNYRYIPSACITNYFVRVFTLDLAVQHVCSLHGNTVQATYLSARASHGQLAAYVLILCEEQWRCHLRMQARRTATLQHNFPRNVQMRTNGRHACVLAKGPPLVRY